jgi:hypothetical protein
MIRGISNEEISNFNLIEYSGINDLENIIQNFFRKIFNAENKS